MVTVPAGKTSTERPQAPATRIERYFTTPGVPPFDEVTWERRSASIADESGEAVFEQHDVEVPDFYSQTATNVVVSKYFRGPLGTPQRETSVRQLITRVVGTLTGWGRDGGYFPARPAGGASEEEADTFADELTYLLLHQKACFNSPVWFNVGVEEKPQCSACFILSVGDTMESILEWCKTEGMIFKGGSGSGINLSPIRSSREQLSTGGQASGPVSFMRGADAIAGSIKSGGKTRRAAKMVVLNADHPDVLEFIECKAQEERKAYDLGAAGWDLSLNGEAWASIQFQNANNSVRATDEFMQAAVEDRDWELRAVTAGGALEVVKAREVLRRIAQATWECGDPGMQFDTTANRWHTCPESGRINASNPCAEYMHVDDSACNLASLNLLKFLDEDPSAGSGQARFDIEAFRRAVATMIWAQEIIVGRSSYPTPKIEGNAQEMRQLGLGYANLGALLMALGIPYDSDAGRAYAAAITALMTGHAYATSAAIAERVGPFAAYARNREPMLRVIGQHRDAAYALGQSKEDGSPGPGPRTLDPLMQAAREAWDGALELGRAHGYRNAQATVLAPTGTIAFMMDCDTTGIEPDIALVKYKKLVGGGLMKMVNGTVPLALRRLGYGEAAVAEMVRYIDEQGTIEGAPGLREEHLPVFDCAFKAEKGQRSIHHLGHIKMMGAAQPFISGAISKTVNLPQEATVEEIMDAYIEAWRHGLKAIAIYRDGSKKVQPLSTGSGGTNVRADGQPPDGGPSGPVRRGLPDTRKSTTHKFKIEGHTGYITVGLYEDGSPAEVFLSMAKQGSTIYGMMESFGRSISYALQYGVPLRDLVRNFSHMRFEPSGRTENPEIPFAQSVIDYLFRWLASQFLSTEEVEELGILTPEVKQRMIERLDRMEGGANGGDGFGGQAAEVAGAGVARPDGRPQTAARLGPSGRSNGQSDAPVCAGCGWIMIRSGTCYRCENCGSTSGCS